jgi:hypothetical protein
MKKRLTRSRAMNSLVLAIGAFALARCASVPAGTGEAVQTRGAAQNASANDPSVTIFPIADAQHGNYDLLASNHRGYRLSCTNSMTGLPDQTGVRNLELGLGFSSTDLGKLPAPVDIGDTNVQAAVRRDPINDPPVGYGDLVDLDCHMPQGDLIEFDIPLDGGTDGGDAGTDHRLFVRMAGDRDPATDLPVARNVGCGGLLLGMGLNPLIPAIQNIDLLDQNNQDFVVSDTFDISCHAGRPPSGYQPALFANPSTPELVSRGQVASVEFTTSENDLVPTSAVLVPTGTTDCIDPATGTTFLKIQPPTTDLSGRWGWPVTGTVPGGFVNQTCSASYYLTYTVAGAPIQTSPATFTVNMGCREGTLTDCSGCGDTCKAPANGAPVCKTTGPIGPGVCTFACNSGFAGCDGTDCAQMGTLANCGGCGSACPATLPNGNSVCSTAAPGSWGKCDVTCNAGFNNCDSDPYNGCESNPQTDPNNCGKCGNKCSAGCTNGVCDCVPQNVICTASDCGDKSDGCGRVYHCQATCSDPAKPTCVNNSCVCVPEAHDCSQSCGGTQTDNCGNTYRCPTFAPGAPCCRHTGGDWINGRCQ